MYTIETNISKTSNPNCLEINNQRMNPIETIGTIAPIQLIELLAKTYFSSINTTNDPTTNTISLINTSSPKTNVIFAPLKMVTQLFSENKQLVL